MVHNSGDNCRPVSARLPIDFEVIPTASGRGFLNFPLAAEFAYMTFLTPRRVDKNNVM